MIAARSHCASRTIRRDGGKNGMEGKKWKNRMPAPRGRAKTKENKFFPLQSGSNDIILKSIFQSRMKGSRKCSKE